MATAYYRLEGKLKLAVFHCLFVILVCNYTPYRDSLALLFLHDSSVSRRRSFSLPLSLEVRLWMGNNNVTRNVGRFCLAWTSV